MSSNQRFAQFTLAAVWCVVSTLACRGGVSETGDAHNVSTGDVDGAGTTDAADDGGAQDANVTNANGTNSNTTNANTTNSNTTNTSQSSPYDAVVLADTPVAFWPMQRSGATEADLTGHGNVGSYAAGTPKAATLPNGDVAADFDGAQQYLTVPSNPAFSIATTGTLTWEAWIRPDVLEFPNDDGSDGYVAWMGKCAVYAPSCEWEARMYRTTTAQGRPNRFSGYAFNPTAGLGSAADWQPASGVVAAGSWYHVVTTYTTVSQPANCPNAVNYPGSVDIWVNGVKWNQSYHGTTGCMSQYNVVPRAGTSPVNIGSMALDSFFPGAIGKVAFYDHALTQAQIAHHYNAMTGAQVHGQCANTCSL